MHKSLSLKVPALETLCRDHGVRSLHAFGSVLGPEFDESSSDIDLVVEFADPNLGPWMRRFFAFREAAEAILGRRVDLHLLSALQDTRLGAIIRESKVPLYAAA